MSTKLQIQLQHDDDGFLIGKKRIKTLENTVAATHKNSEAILSHIKIQKSGQRMVVSGRLRLDGSSQAQSTPTTPRKPIVQTNRPHLANTSNKAQPIGNANTAHPLANQGEHQKKKQLTREQRRYRDAQARSNQRQELMLKEINKNLKINQGGLLSGLKKLLPLLAMLSSGAGLLKNLSKVPAVVANGGKNDPKNKKKDDKDKSKIPVPPVVATGNKTPTTVPPVVPPKKNKIRLPSQAPVDPNTPKGKFWDKVKSGGKLLGKGGLLAGAVVLLQGIGVEGSDLERPEKNKEHAKNATVATGGVAGALAGGAAGAAIGSAFPVVGTAIGGVVGAIIGGIGGSTLADYFVERLDEAIDEDLSKDMFSSWDGFVSGMEYGGRKLWKWVLPDKFKVFFDKLGVDTSSLLSTIKGIANTTWDAIGIAGKSLWNKVMPEKAQVFFDQLSKEGKAAFEAFKKGFKDLFDAIAESTVGQKVGDGWDYVKDKANDAWEKTKEMVGIGGDGGVHDKPRQKANDEARRPGASPTASNNGNNMYSMDAGAEVPKANQQAQQTQQGSQKAVTWDDLKLKKVSANFQGKTVTESIGGGNTEQGTKQLAGALQKRFGQNIKHFSGFNDVHHQLHSPRSLHTKGLAMDFSLQDDKGRVLSWDEGYKLDQQKNIRGQITAEIKSAGLSDKDFKILDYSPKQRHGTGPHYHIEFKSKDAAGVYAAHSLGQNSVSRPVNSTSNKSNQSSQSNQIGMNAGALQLTDQDIEDLIKVTDTEVVKFKDQATFEAQTRGVVDTILNRTASGKWGNSVRDVANAKSQFTKINGPKGYYANGKWVANNPYGSVQNMPSSAVNVRTRAYVMKYLEERANGQASSVGNHLNYANPNMSDEKNKKAWVNDMEASARKEGMVFGAGKNIHVHGTTKDLQSRRPSEFRVSLGSKPSQTKPKLHQVKTPPVVQPKSQQVAMNANTVALSATNIQPQEIKLPTSSKGASAAYQGSIGGQIAHAPIKRQVSHPEIANVTSGGTGA